DFDLSQTEKAFRDEVRAWLKANAPRDRDGHEMKTFIDNRRAWQRKLHEAGYVGITWPEEYGGRGGSFLDQLFFNDEMILAHAPKWCMLLARESKEPIPRVGLTYLLVDMESPGIAVRPLVQITGDAEFNEIFFKDVKVPKSQILGEAGKGWAVAMTTLLHE